MPAKNILETIFAHYKVNGIITFVNEEKEVIYG